MANLKEVLERELREHNAGVKRQTESIIEAEANRQREDEAKAKEIIDAFPSLVRNALRDNRKSVKLVSIGSVYDLRKLVDVGRLVYDALVADGLGDKLFVGIDCSGSLSSNNTLNLRLR